MITSPFRHIRIAVRGGGDLGSGVVYRLHRCGFPVLVTELAQPLLLRRTVAFGSAVFEGAVVVEGVTARQVGDLKQALAAQNRGEVPVLTDPEGRGLADYSPTVLVDARMLKGDPGRQPVVVPLVISLGPGFSAPEHCHAVIETNRGHYLGRVIWKGTAQANTGAPGNVMGRTTERVLRAPTDGEVTGLMPIGAAITEKQPVAEVGGQIVKASFAGVLRGVVHDGVMVRAGVKIADIDPRGDPSACFSISDKALAVGGGVLEAILSSPAIWGRLRQS